MKDFQALVTVHDGHCDVQLDTAAQEEVTACAKKWGLDYNAAAHQVLGNMLLKVLAQITVPGDQSIKVHK
jgi:hypothetical protein